MNVKTIGLAIAGLFGREIITNMDMQVFTQRLQSHPDLLKAVDMICECAADATTSQEVHAKIGFIRSGIELSANHLSPNSIAELFSFLGASNDKTKTEPQSPSADSHSPVNNTDETATDLLAKEKT